MTDAVWQRLSEEHQQLKARLSAATPVEQGTGEYQLDRTPSPDVATAVDAERLRELNEALLRVPEGFSVHPKLKRPLEQRREAMGADGGINWAHAEALAFASLLTEGTPVRLTGQDAERGTFSQRHLVLHDPKTGQEYCPIQHLPNALAPMELHNSPLSEMAALGFEYGYSQEGPETLVLWEAQFGDFVNSAQVIVDQFIISGLAKWGQSTRLTLLLPARLRGLGPGALLRAPGALAAARRRGQHPRRLPVDAGAVLPPAAAPGEDRQAAPADRDDAEVAAAPAAGDEPHRAPRRDAVLPGAGRAARREREGHAPDPLLRQGLLRPRRRRDARRTTRASRSAASSCSTPSRRGRSSSSSASYPNLREVVWLQEEPRNMGARAHMSPRLMQILPRELKFGYIGRPERASTAEGYPAAHAMEQRRIVRPRWTSRARWACIRRSCPVSGNRARSSRSSSASARRRRASCAATATSRRARRGSRARC